jgi:sugar/nucleoside kinase (ribokinase family)
MSLLTVGTVAFDDIETPLGRAERVVGGAATYISLAASHFVQPIQIVSVIGDDFPQETLDELKSKGVDLDGLQLREGEKSFFWSGRYHEDLNTRDTLITDLNVLADFDPVLPDSYKNTPYVMLGNLTPAVQMRVIDQMESRPKLIALDTMNFWIDSALDSLKEVIGRIDMLIINDEEARQLTGEYSLVKAARVIHEMGPRYIAVKKGEHGALLFYDNDVFFAPALPLAEVYDPTGAGVYDNDVFFAPALPLAEVYDPTGAGDTFAGGLMGYLASTDDLSFDNMKRAIIYGSAMASFCVEAFSIERLQGLNKEMIRERVGEFVDLTRFDAELHI